MSGNLFGDLNRDGQEDWRDDMLGMIVLETLSRQEREAAGDDSGPAYSSGSGSGGVGIVVLAFGGLLFLGWLCSLFGR